MGHLFRALALAESLESQGAKACIYINEDERAARILRGRSRFWRTAPLADLQHDWESGFIKADGVKVWVDDRHDTDIRHARRVIEAGVRLATFDDRGTGAAHADLNIVAVPLTDDERIAGRRTLSGLRYLVLDPAIARYKRRRHACNSVVVSMGGSDTYGVTVEVVRALRDRGRTATVVVGPGFAHDAALNGVLDGRFPLKRSVTSLTEELSLHDLAITAGGITPFEANAAGLPCIVIATEMWEARAGKLLAALGGCIYAGWREEIDFAAFDVPMSIERMSSSALENVPADGAARVAAELLAL